MEISVAAKDEEVMVIWHFNSKSYKLILNLSYSILLTLPTGTEQIFFGEDVAGSDSSGGSRNEIADMAWQRQQLHHRDSTCYYSILFIQVLRSPHPKHKGEA